MDVIQVGVRYGRCIDGCSRMESFMPASILVYFTLRIISFPASVPEYIAFRMYLMVEISNSPKFFWAVSNGHREFTGEFEFLED